jgi:hypothetical protein
MAAFWEWADPVTPQTIFYMPQSTPDEVASDQ